MHDWQYEIIETGFAIFSLICYFYLFIHVLASADREKQYYKL